ncbi:uncharacterized protein Dana_GF12708 [Drosophila ananassae]|uniref:Single domain-containing protein n=1 Tax=Drosophila ananassae TaxID=7217 RepID=B3MI73_DROAN|nr:uncharacterized protein LOC6495555 [Drosophila ananassae]EDV35918.2 uncharacterized protein Dana_GF12708 [Drosophila ananassae]
MAASKKCCVALVCGVLLPLAMAIIGIPAIRLKYRIQREAQVYVYNRNYSAAAQLEDANRLMVEVEESPVEYPLEDLQMELLKICDKFARDPCKFWQLETCPPRDPLCYIKPPENMCRPWLPGCNTPIPPENCWLTAASECPEVTPTKVALFLKF